MSKSYKLRCFNCTRKFRSKEEVWRDNNGFPICKCCLEDVLLYDDWDDDSIDYVMDDIENKFKKNYKNWQKWFYANHSICQGEHRTYSRYYWLTEQMAEVDGKLFCPGCMDKLVEIHSGGLIGKISEKNSY